MKMAKVNNGHIWGHACTVHCTCSFLSGEMLTKYISMTNTTSRITENMINFDSEGNVAGNYDVLNFQHNTSSDCTEPCYNMIKVGAWKNNQLTLFNEKHKVRTLATL